jgi:hypothetical protein
VTGLLAIPANAQVFGEDISTLVGSSSDVASSASEAIDAVDGVAEVVETVSDVKKRVDCIHDIGEATRALITAYDNHFLENAKASTSPRSMVQAVAEAHITSDLTRVAGLEPNA